MLKTPKIYFAESTEQIHSCFKIMQQLRPHLDSEQAFVSQVKRQIEHGYHLAYLVDEEEIKALVGYRFLEFLAWGKILYIDDFITDKTARKKGHGSHILKWVIKEGEKASCDQIHLDSGPQRHEAHRLYLNCGFKIIGYHFNLVFKE